MTTELSTDRLILSMPSQVDYPAYVAFYSDADASTFYGGPLRPDGAWKRLAEDIGHWSLRGFGVWSLRDRKTAETLGGCGLWHPEGWPRRELTWWLLPSARGGGLATEASVRVIDHALSELAWPFVETHFDDRNFAARRLAQRLGGERVERLAFPDGVERDVWRFPGRV